MSRLPRIPARVRVDIAINDSLLFTVNGKTRSNWRVKSNLLGSQLAAAPTHTNAKAEARSVE
jgi:hypothetical protein